MFFDTFLLFFSLAFLSIFLCFLLFFLKVLYRQVIGNARYGRSRHRPTNQSFRVCDVDFAALKVAIMLQRIICACTDSGVRFSRV